MNRSNAMHTFFTNENDNYTTILNHDYFYQYPCEKLEQGNINTIYNNKANEIFLSSPLLSSLETEALTVLSPSMERLFSTWRNCGRRNSLTNKKRIIQPNIGNYDILFDHHHQQQQPKGCTCTTESNISESSYGNDISSFYEDSGGMYTPPQPLDLEPQKISAMYVTKDAQHFDPAQSGSSKHNHNRFERNDRRQKDVYQLYESSSHNSYDTLSLFDDDIQLQYNAQMREDEMKSQLLDDRFDIVLDELDHQQSSTCTNLLEGRERIYGIMSNSSSIPNKATYSCKGSEKKYNAHRDITVTNSVLENLSTERRHENGPMSIRDCINEIDLQWNCDASFRGTRTQESEQPYVPETILPGGMNLNDDSDDIVRSCKLIPLYREESVTSKLKLKDDSSKTRLSQQPQLSRFHAKDVTQDEELDSPNFCYEENASIYVLQPNAPPLSPLRRKETMIPTKFIDQTKYVPGGSNDPYSRIESVSNSNVSSPLQVKKKEGYFVHSTKMEFNTDHYTQMGSNDSMPLRKRVQRPELSRHHVFHQNKFINEKSEKHEYNPKHNILNDASSTTCSRRRMTQNSMSASHTRNSHTLLEPHQLLDETMHVSHTHNNTDPLIPVPVVTDEDFSIKEFENCCDASMLNKRCNPMAMKIQTTPTGCFEDLKHDKTNSPKQKNTIRKIKRTTDQNDPMHNHIYQPISDMHREIVSSLFNDSRSAPKTGDDKIFHNFVYSSRGNANAGDQEKENSLFGDSTRFRGRRKKGKTRVPNRPLPQRKLYCIPEDCAMGLKLPLQSSASVVAKPFPVIKDTVTSEEDSRKTQVLPDTAPINETNSVNKKNRQDTIHRNGISIEKLKRRRHKRLKRRQQISLEHMKLKSRNVHHVEMKRYHHVIQTTNSLLRVAKKHSKEGHYSDSFMQYIIALNFCQKHGVPRGHPTTKDINDGIHELKEKVFHLPIKRREEILVKLEKRAENEIKLKGGSIHQAITILKVTLELRKHILEKIILSTSSGSDRRMFSNATGKKGKECCYTEFDDFPSRALIDSDASSSSTTDSSDVDCTCSDHTIKSEHMQHHQVPDHVICTTARLLKLLSRCFVHQGNLSSSRSARREAESLFQTDRITL